MWIRAMSWWKSIFFFAKWGLFFFKILLNGPIRLRSNRHWSFASTKGNRYKLYRVHPKKLWLPPYRPTLRSSPSLKLFIQNVKSIVWLFLRLECEVMDPCFVHSNESMQKFIWNSLRWNISKHYFEIVTRLRLSTVSKRGIHLANSFIIPNSCKIEITVPCDMPVASTSSRTFTRRSVKTIVDFIDDFWRSSLNWTSRTRCITRPCLNSFMQLYTVATLVQMCYEHYPTRFWFLSVLNLFFI